MELLSLSTISQGAKPPDGTQQAASPRPAKPARAAAERAPQPEAPSARGGYQVSLDVDKRLNRVVATIKHPVTGEVIEQLPPEQIRNIAADIREKLAHVVDERA